MCDFFSFKVIIHEIQLNYSAIFEEMAYQEIKNPAILMKLLDFPLILIQGSKIHFY